MVFSEKGLAKRSPHNPILSALPQLKWANIKVYNPAIVEYNDKVHMIFRAIGDDWISRLGHATMNNFSIEKITRDPIIEPTELYESHGIEDPRITIIDKTFVLAYTAYDGKCARLAIATSKDLIKWKKLGPVLNKWDKGFWQSISNGVNNWSKAGALFPEKINNKYTMLFGDDHIWYAQSEDLQNWEIKENAVIQPRANMFDGGYVEMGSPPIKTTDGWLVLYHGVQRVDDIPGDPRIYRIGAALLDLNDPSILLWRSTIPLLEPIDKEKYGIVDALQYEGGYNQLQEKTKEEIEKNIDEGLSPLALFTCGAIKLQNDIHIFYSSADTHINLATISIENILNH